MVMKSYFKNLAKKFCKHKKQTAVDVYIKGVLPFITCVCNKCEEEFCYPPHQLNFLRFHRKRPKIEVSNKILLQIDKAWNTIQKEWLNNEKNNT